MSQMFKLLIILGAIFSWQVCLDAKEPPKIEVSTLKIKGNIHVLQSQGGNVLVMTGPQGVFLVDNGLANAQEEIRIALYNLDALPVRFIINTHYHADHTGGNSIHGQKGSVIVAHKNVRHRLSKKQIVNVLEKQFDPTPLEGLPVITFTEDINFHINNNNIHILHVENAHTDGDSLVFLKEANILHMGDVFFNGLYPFIDYENGGSISGMIKAGKAALKIVDRKTIIIPGHGPLGSANDLKTFIKMLEHTEKSISQLKKDGKTLEQVIQTNPLSEYDNEGWGKGYFDSSAFIGFVYKGL